MMIERATGRSHAELLRERIFGPLPMNNTYYLGHDKLPADSPGICQHLQQQYGQQRLELQHRLWRAARYGWGHAVFINALFNQKTLVAGQSLDQMMQFSPGASPDKQYGLGVVKEFLNYAPGRYGYGHSGGDLGYTADLYWLPEKQASLALIVNCGTDRIGSLNTAYENFKTELADRIVE